MSGYLCYYKNEIAEVHAETSYKAQLEAAQLLRVNDKNRYKITVVLCERKGAPVVHSAGEF